MLNFKLLIILSFVFIGCQRDNQDAPTIQSSPTIELTDTILLTDIGYQILFNDNQLFDTTYPIFTFDMCTPLHQSGIRRSNSKYYNEDTLAWSLLETDSLLNVTVSQFEISEYVSSYDEQLERKYAHRKITEIALGNKFNEPEIKEIYVSHGLNLGLIGSTNQQESGTSMSYLEVFGLIDTIGISAQLTYLGKSNDNYLEKFEQIAKSVVVEKL